MKTRFIIVLLILLNGLISQNGFAEESVANTPVPATDITEPLAENGFDQYGYYTFRPDLRACISPLCGGIFVKAVNRVLTRCVDGSLKAECYVATVNNKQNLDIGAAALLHGRIKAKIYEGFGNLGVFDLQAAFSSATAAVGEGSFVGLENNGILCITTPCFSVDQYLLNKNKLRVISGIDFTEVGAAKELIDKAYAIMADGGVLLSVGVNKQVVEVAGIGVSFVANQFYLPIEPVVVP